MLREGSWSLRSEKDPRWDANGQGLVGMFCGPESVPEAKAMLDRNKELYGEPPDDLEWSYCKY